MYRSLLVVAILTVPVAVLADPVNVQVQAPGNQGGNVVSSYVDLRAAHALETLQRTNPAHFEKIQKMLAGLEEQPSRVEGDWLQVTFNAQEVDLTRMVVKTSYPPKQVLSFRLDDVRYTMYVARRDMVGEFMPAR